MRKASIFAVALIVSLLIMPALVSARRIGRPRTHHGHHHSLKPQTREVMAARPNSYMERRQPRKKGSDTVQVAGSSLPNCSHACGSCIPCRLVMVSFVCSSLEEAETCPIAYKCMCHNKSYPVP